MALIIGFFTFIGAWIFAIVDAYNMAKNGTVKLGFLKLYPKWNLHG